MGKDSKKKKKIIFKSKDKSKILERNTFVTDNKVSISLKHYNKNKQCFSEWADKSLLASFSNFISKVNQRTTEQCKKNFGHSHQVDSSDAKFKGVKFYRLNVTQQAKIHGFFNNDIFYLVWLDKSHKSHK